MCVCFGEGEGRDIWWSHLESNACVHSQIRQCRGVSMGVSVNVILNVSMSVCVTVCMSVNVSVNECEYQCEYEYGSLMPV